MQFLPTAFNALAAYNQFILYKLVPSSRPGKTDKLPIDYRTGRMPEKGSGAQSIWTSAEIAITHAAQLNTLDAPVYGVGFSFAETDPFFFLDIDNCLDASGQWSPLALSLLTALPGAAVEVSQSGRGLHIIGKGVPPPHGCKNTPLGLELYHCDRFVALTGTSVVGDAGLDMSYALPWLVNSYFPLSVFETDLVGWSSEPVEEWRGPTDDAVLIERALRSKVSAASAFGNRATFADLWLADEQALALAYPSSTEDRYDRSSADAALAQHLAFWTGKDCERVMRLMNGSGLVREKWEREKYMLDTISKACGRQIDVLRDKLTEVTTIDQTTGAISSTPSLVNGSTYADVTEQVRMFTGCVYVRDAHKVLIPGGMLLKPDQFRVAYGGFTFPMDNSNERSSRNAWEAFTESQAFRAPRADTSCFRPDLAPGEIIAVDGQVMVNTYWPVETPRMAGDAAPFLAHLNKILPLERDRTVLIAYMAACVQHKGVKFQWAPLIQGVEGNGKSLLTRCVSFAIGQRYSYLPKASKIAAQFNSWMEGRIFIGVEDVYVPHSQQDILEELKPMITGERQEIEKKGVDQVNAHVCCNFILNCNNKSALRKTRNDRRLAVFYCAQQDLEDLIRDGMGGNYFPNLYMWLREGGYEIVNDYLHNYAIPSEHNPANGHIAPFTSATEEALTYGLGRAEQEILEAIEREEQGFRGGWVSSMAVDKLLERINAASRIPPNKRRDLMLNLGYDYHPNLHNGRVNNSVLPDGGKTRLFVKKTNAALWGLTGPADIARIYSLSQNS